MAQGHLKRDQNELIDEKTGCKKSRETVPLNQVTIFILSISEQVKSTL